MVVQHHHIQRTDGIFHISRINQQLPHGIHIKLHPGDVNRRQFAPVIFNILVHYLYPFISAFHVCVQGFPLVSTVLCCLLLHSVVQVVLWLAPLFQCFRLQQAAPCFQLLPLPEFSSLFPCPAVPTPALLPSTPVLWKKVFGQCLAA